MLSAIDLNAFRQDLAAKLEAEDLAVTLDPRNVNPPMVVIGLPVVTGRLNACAVNVEIEISPVAPGPGNLDSIQWLLDTVPVVMEVANADTATPSTMSVRTGQDPWPCYHIVVVTTAT